MTLEKALQLVKSGGRVRAEYLQITIESVRGVLYIENKNGRAVTTIEAITRQFKSTEFVAA